MAVGDLLSRAISTPEFTAIVVVPAPPLAPMNTIVRAAVVPTVAATRVDARLTASWKVDSGGGQAKNSLAPARMARRIRSGAQSAATAKTPAGFDARQCSARAIA